MRSILPTIAASALALLAGAARAETRVAPGAQYPTIQAAIDASSSGDVILIAPGVHEEPLVLTQRTGLVIKGKKAILDGGGGATAITLDGCTNVSIERLAVRNAVVVIDIVQGTGNSLVGVEVTEALTTGVRLDTTLNTRISRCTLTGAAGGAVRDGNSTGLVVEKCRLSAGALATVMSLSANGGATRSTTVTANRFEAGGTGIRYTGRNLTFSRNRFDGLANDGILLADGGQTEATTVERNTFLPGVGGHAIVVGGIDAVVERNRITGVGGRGIESSAEGGNIERNRIVGAGLSAIYVRGPDLTVTGNLCRGSVQNGVYAGSARNTYTSNKVLANGLQGFFVEGAPNTFTRNTGRGNGGFDFIDASPAGGNILDRNRFQRESLYIALPPL